MPTYAYECQACHHHFEELQSFKDPPLKKCPKCKKNKVERIISGGAGFIFKGDGFYETDYRSDSYKKDSEKDSGKTSNEQSEKKNSSSTSKSESSPGEKPKKKSKDKKKEN